MLARGSVARSRGCAGAGCRVSGRRGQNIRRPAVPDEPLYPPVPTVDDSVKPVVETLQGNAVVEQQVRSAERLSCHQCL